MVGSRINGLNAGATIDTPIVGSILKDMDSIGTMVGGGTTPYYTDNKGKGTIEEVKAEDTSTSNVNEFDTLKDLMLSDLDNFFGNSEAQDEFVRNYSKSGFGIDTPKDSKLHSSPQWITKMYGVSGKAAGHGQYLLLGYYLANKLFNSIPGAHLSTDFVKGAAIGAGMSASSNMAQKAVIDPLFNEESLKTFINKLFKDALIGSTIGSIARYTAGRMNAPDFVKGLSQFVDEGFYLGKKVFGGEEPSDLGGRGW